MNTLFYIIFYIFNIKNDNMYKDLFKISVFPWLYKG